MITSIIFTGCSSKGTAPSAPAQSAPAQQPKVDYSKGAESGTAPNAQDTAVAQTPNRKLIVKLFMQMRVDDIDKSINDVGAMALTSGGYIRESNQSEYNGQLTVMIPAGNVDTFTQNLKNFGKIINSTRNTEDVTDSYFDTQVRIKNLETEIETMRNLLQKQGWKVSEILEIEREIRRLTDELETLKGYITNLDRQVTYSEVRISFEKSQIAIDNSDKDGLGYKLKLALKGGVDVLRNVITGILTMLVFLLPISPFVVIGYFIIRYVSRRFAKKGKEELKQ
jgi:hypothetical protein